MYPDFSEAGIDVSASAGPSGGTRDHPQPVRPASERAAPRAAPGEPERVAAGQHVPQPGEHAEPLPAAPELDVELRERAQLAAACSVAHLPGLHREDGRVPDRRPGSCSSRA